MASALTPEDAGAAGGDEGVAAARSSLRSPSPKLEESQRTLARLREHVNQLKAETTELRTGGSPRTSPARPYSRSNSGSRQAPPVDLDESIDVLDKTDLIDLSDADLSGSEDEWLYASPAHPATPAQKAVSPQDWLRSDHARLELDRIRNRLAHAFSECLPDAAHLAPPGPSDAFARRKDLKPSNSFSDMESELSGSRSQRVVPALSSSDGAAAMACQPNPNRVRRKHERAGSTESLRLSSQATTSRLPTPGSRLSTSPPKRAPQAAAAGSVDWGDDTY